MKKIGYIIGIIILGQGLFAQQQNEYSLQQAIDYALQHNFDIRNAKTDIKIAKKKVVETRAIGLPHINASVGYDYFIDIPTQLMPDFITPTMMQVNQQVFGLIPVVPVSGDPQMLEMKFGQKHNISAGITATQLLFNGSYLVGLQASSAYVRLSQAMLEKKEKEVRHSVAKAYYPVIIIQENLILLDSTLISLQEMLLETKALQEEGFLEDTDVDQMGIMINDIQNTKRKLENTQEMATKNLKFQMGMTISTPILLTEKLQTLLETVASLGLESGEFNVAKHQDYRLLQASKALAILDVKNTRAALLPMLSAYFNYQEKAMRDEFDFFDTDQNWFPTQVVGAKLEIPIFQSWQSKAKIQQKKLELEKVKVQEMQLEEALSLKYHNTKSNLSYSIDVFYNKKLKVTQSQRIYTKTKVKFQEGMASSLELSQVFNQYLQAQMEYLNAMMELLTNKENMEQQIGK